MTTLDPSLLPKENSYMSALHGFWDWVLFGLALILALFSLVLFLNLIVLLSRAVKMGFVFLLFRFLYIVVFGLLAYWLLFDHLGIFS